MRSTAIRLGKEPFRLPRTMYRALPLDIKYFFESRPTPLILHPAITKLEFHVPHVFNQGRNVFQPKVQIPIEARQSESQKEHNRITHAANLISSLRAKISLLQGIEGKEDDISNDLLKLTEIEDAEQLRLKEAKAENALALEQEAALYDKDAHSLQFLAYDNPTIPFEFIHPPVPETDHEAYEHSHGALKSANKPRPKIQSAAGTKIVIHLDNTSEPQVVTLDSPRPFPIAQVLSDPALHATTNPDFAGLLEKASQAYLEVEREKTKRREAWFGKMDIQAKVKAAANMVEENGSVVDQAR